MSVCLIVKCCVRLFITAYVYLSVLRLTKLFYSMQESWEKQQIELQKIREEAEASKVSMSICPLLLVFAADLFLTFDNFNAVFAYL